MNANSKWSAAMKKAVPHRNCDAEEPDAGEQILGAGSDHHPIPHERGPLSAVGTNAPHRWPVPVAPEETGTWKQLRQAPVCDGPKQRNG